MSIVRNAWVAASIIVCGSACSAATVMPAREWPAALTALHHATNIPILFPIDTHGILDPKISDEPYAFVGPSGAAKTYYTINLGVGSGCNATVCEVGDIGASATPPGVMEPSSGSMHVTLAHAIAGTYDPPTRTAATPMSSLAFAVGKNTYTVNLKGDRKADVIRLADGMILHGPW